MNVLAWWFALMFVAWIATALVLWKTNIVVQDEGRELNDEERERRG